jgi:zinc protease
MWSLDITQANLDNQRNAVQEERRLGVDNQPYGRTYEAIGELAYRNFAYAHSVIGSMADLNAADVSDVKAFFKTYYAPNNAVLSIVGDVNTKDCLQKIEKYFNRIPSQPAPPAVDMTEPPQMAERRQTIDDPLARLARVDISWHTPPGNTPDDDALTILGSVLTSGRSSRMYESLVRQGQLTNGVNAYTTSMRGPSLFQVSSTVQVDKPVADLEAGIYAEIEKVKAGPIADWEIDKARNNQKRAFISGLGSSLQRAVLLGQYAMFWNDPNLINTRADRLGKVTAADVQRVAKQYLTQANRSVVVTNPKTQTAGKGGR